PSLLSCTAIVLRAPPPRPTLFPYTTLFRSLTDRESRPPRLQPPPNAAAASCRRSGSGLEEPGERDEPDGVGGRRGGRAQVSADRSEEHTSELQSHLNLVCRLLLEKKNNRTS